MRPPWQNEVWRRLGTLPALKISGTVTLMTGFFVAYFHLLEHPYFPVHVVPRLPLDDWIGVWPPALWLYVSLWVYIPMAPALTRDRAEFWRYGCGALLLGGLGLLFFFLCPTTIGPLGIDWTRYPTLAFLKDLDAAGNALPSLHVAYAVYTGWWLNTMLREWAAPRTVQIGNALWAMGIVYSTLATKQHLIWDVLAGTALGGQIAFWAIRRNHRALSG